MLVDALKHARSLCDHCHHVWSFQWFCVLDFFMQAHALLFFWGIVCRRVFLVLHDAPERDFPAGQQARRTQGTEPAGMHVRARMDRDVGVME